MTKLTVLNREGTLLVESREVAEMTEVRHADLMRSISGYIRILENAKLRSQDFFISSNYKVEGNNKTYDCFLLTRKGCDMVANKMTGEKGVLFTAAYVTQFEQMERRLSSPQIPQSLPEALRLAADLAEQKEMLKLQIERDRPKVVFAEALETSRDSVLVADMAKILKQNGIEIGEIRFFKWLRENGYLIKAGSERNMPTQRSMELKIMEIKIGQRASATEGFKQTRTPKITGKGQIYFINKFKGPGTAVVGQ